MKNIATALLAGAMLLGASACAGITSTVPNTPQSMQSPTRSAQCITPAAQREGQYSPQYVVCQPVSGDPNGGPPPCLSACGNPTGGSGGGTVAKNTTCNGALASNTGTDGTNNHNSQISGSFAVWASVAGTNTIVAYEYQTYGGSEYIQFLTSIAVSAGAGVAVSVGPTGITLFPFNGSVYNALQGALSAAHVAQSALPFPYNSIAASTAISKNSCAAPTGA